MPRLRDRYEPQLAQLLRPLMDGPRLAAPAAMAARSSRAARCGRCGPPRGGSGPRARHSYASQQAKIPHRRRAPRSSASASRRCRRWRRGRGPRTTARPEAGAPPRAKRALLHGSRSLPPGLIKFGRSVKRISGPTSSASSSSAGQRRSNAARNRSTTSTFSPVLSGASFMAVLDPDLRGLRQADLRRHLHELQARGPGLCQRRLPDPQRQLHRHPPSPERRGARLCTDVANRARRSFRATT